MERNVDLSRFDDAFVLAYSLVESHIQAGNADTASLPECLAGLIQVIQSASGAEPGDRQPEHHK